jgi:adenine/guanine phosphoribosyltransferase-like PRPP-binding protein
MLEERKTYISDSIRQVPDFPKKGILFHDVTTLLLDPKVRPEPVTLSLKLLLTHYACGKCASIHFVATSLKALRVMCSTQAFQYSVDDFVDRYKGKGIEAVVGTHVVAIAVSPALPAQLRAPVH